jgi:hypothetical protein
MLLSRLGVLTLCVFCLQCGSQTPVTPTTASPPPIAPSSPVPTDPSPASPPSPPGITEVFVGAGDIANCGPNSEATARLLDAIAGTVFTLGDNAYP